VWSELNTRLASFPRILSDGERAFFKGENEVKDLDGYQRNARNRARQRMDQIEVDLYVLREAGQEDLVEEFVNRFGRVERLVREVKNSARNWAKTLISNQ